MKRFCFIGLVIALALSSCDDLFDDDDDYGRRGTKTTTVAGLLGLRDDTHVRLTGEITKKLWYEIYEFKDETGTVEVEIEYEDWRRASLNPNSLPVRVEIRGEMDKEHGWHEIDVDRITKL